MKITIDRTNATDRRPEEADLLLDPDGDLNIVMAATHVSGLREEDLVVCCLAGDAAWVRGRADAATLAGMTRLTTGDRIIITVE
ncbi:MAG: hypothetical protein EA406_08860 [Rhodospirillales bacterium]|nr:MAG: hypothetical protein EA406_08860 [Rhodospirillales bacterium]